MGLEKTISGDTSKLIWEKFVESLATAGIPYAMRMIDRMPAFPDELPPENWVEIRFSCDDGMLTVRRTTDAISVVVWGNADQKLQDRMQQVTGILQSMVA
ncbi:MAG: hypothetical protein R3B84_09610 [Zavarzinella sp.]